MGISLTKKTIKQWCGHYAYQKGERLCRTNNVRFQGFNPDTDEYAADVGNEEVRLAFDSYGKPNAQCTCPSLRSFDTYCQHIAAVLIHLYDFQQTGGFSAAALVLGGEQPEGQSERTRNIDIAGRILGLFADKPERPIRNRTLAETRTPLQAEFILKVLACNNNSALFGLELKVGPQTLYIVRNIASFLDQLSRGECCPITARFSYDPEIHSFEPETEAVLIALIELARNRVQMQETERAYFTHASRAVSERMLPIPAQAWASLLPLLTQVPKLTVMDGDIKYDGLHITDDPLPLRFDFNQASSGDGRLRVHGLDQATV